MYPAAFCAGGSRKPIFRTPFRSRLPLVAPAAMRWVGVPVRFLPLMFGFALGLFKLVMLLLFLPLAAAGGTPLPPCLAVDDAMGPWVSGGAGPSLR